MNTIDRIGIVEHGRWLHAIPWHTRAVAETEARSCPEMGALATGSRERGRDFEDEPHRDRVCRSSQRLRSDAALASSSSGSFAVRSTESTAKGTFELNVDAWSLVFVGLLIETCSRSWNS